MILTETKTVFLKITGRVQGVWFRGWTKQEVRRLGLSGWVRNLSDGSVEALFHGEENKVNEMIMLCHKGSPASLVTKVEEQRISSLTPPFKDGDFVTLPTY